jgi:hypothetical protein
VWGRRREEQLGVARDKPCVQKGENPEIFKKRFLVPGIPRIYRKGGRVRKLSGGSRSKTLLS